MAQTKGKTETSTTIAGVEGITPYKQKRGEDYMSAEMREHFRNILIVMRQNILDEVDRTVNEMREVDRAADALDRASAEEDMVITLRTRNREGKLLKKIEESLDTIESDEYGYCESCGVEIGVKRLEARPTATLCIDCKTLDEIKEKQHKG